MSAANRYENSADLYDLDVRDIVQSDIPFYKEFLITGSTSVKALQWETTDSYGRNVQKYHQGRKIDIESQIIYPEFFYHVIDGQVEKVIHEQLELKYYYTDQLRSLIQENEFRIVEEFGYYDYTVIEEGSELIFVTKKK